MENSQDQEAVLNRVLSYIHRALPAPPVSVDGDLCILFDADGAGGVDRLSSLPDALLGNIVSRLPVKDAARTAALARRWRPIWRSIPLILVDAHLLQAAGDDEIPTHVDRADSATVAAAVSRILAAHPGPVRCAHLTCCNMFDWPDEVARWLQQLAAKAAQEVFLINRPWPISGITRYMPATIFSMSKLTRLYLAFWWFPDTRALPRGAAFPCLRDLGLCCVVMEDRDMDFVLARSPVLDTLCFEGSIFPTLRLRLVSRSLRRVQIHGSKVESVTIVDAPRLESLVVANSLEPKINFKIGRAPALREFGSFELGKDVLQVGNTVIKAGTPVSTTKIASVTVLALHVQFGVRNDAKMLPGFLKCFPNLKTLHIHSKKTTEPTGRLNLKFWQESGAIEGVRSHMTTIAFHDFRGERSEIAFLRFVIESAQKLDVLVLQYANGYVTSGEEAKSQVMALFAGKRGTCAGTCKVLLLENALSEGTDHWGLERSSEKSDPFALFRCKRGCEFSV